MQGQMLRPPASPGDKKKQRIIIILVCITLALIGVYCVLKNIENKKVKEMYLGAVEYIQEDPFSEELYDTDFQLGFPEEAGRTEKKTFVENGVYHLPIVVILPQKNLSYLVWVECRQNESGNEYSYVNFIEIDAEWSK